MRLALSLIATIALLLANASDDETHLTSKLFHNYNPLIRPVPNVTAKVTIKFGVALIQVINVEERNQILKTNMWLRMKWVDYQMKWDPADYGGIGLIRVEAETTWQPDIVLFNNADGKYEISYKCRILVYHNCFVEWIPPTIYKSSCSIDVSYFPFDQQVCELKFGSWTFNADELDLDWYSGPYIDLRDYVRSGSWDIVDVPGKIQTIPGTGTEPPSTMIIFRLILRRKTLFYTINLLIPCVLTSFLSVLVFYLPAIACEKITLSISILLALIVFLLLLQKTLPPSPVLPLLAKYLLFTFILNIVSIVVTVVISNWSFRTSRTHYMSRWAKILLLGYLPKILFMKRPNHERWKSTLEPDEPPSEDGDVSQKYDYVNSQPAPGSTQNNSSNHVAVVKPTARPVSPYRPLIESTTRMIDPNSSGVKRSAAAVNFIAEHLQESDKCECLISQKLCFMILPSVIIFYSVEALDRSLIKEDWIYAGLVLDRLFLIVFVTITLGGTLKIILDNPHMMDTINEDDVIKKVSEQIAAYEAQNSPSR